MSTAPPRGAAEGAAAPRWAPATRSPQARRGASPGAGTLVGADCARGKLLRGKCTRTARAPRGSFSVETSRATAQEVRKIPTLGRPMHFPPGVRLVWAGACVSAGHFAAHERELIAQRGIGQAGALTVARLPDRALAKEEAVDASNALRLRVRGGGAHSVLRCSGPSKVARRSFITTRLSCNSFLLTRCCRSSLCGVQYARMRAGPRQKYIRWVLFERIRKQSDVNTSKKTHYCTGSRAPRISELFHYSPLLC